MYQTMKICVSCVALWMLASAVKADIKNFADSSIIQDITTPMAEVTPRRPSGGQGASGDVADVLGGAFRQVAQVLLRVQDALRLEVQQVERRAQEALRLQELRTERALRGAVRYLEDKLRNKDEAMRRLREECSSRIQTMENRVNRMEEPRVPSIGREDGVPGGHVTETHLETRMDTLEAKLNKTIEQFSNMEVLIGQLKMFPSSESPSAVPLALTAPSIFTFTSSFSSTSPPTSTTPSHLPFPTLYPTWSATVSRRETSSTASASPTPSFSLSPFPTFTTSNTTSISDSNSTYASPSTSPRPPTASDEERERQRVNLRMREVKERIERERASPSPLGAQLIMAASRGRLEDVRRLLNAGADVNCLHSNGDSPLMKSVFVSKINEAVVSLLLERGADVNAINIAAYSVLHYATMRDHSGRVVTLLLGAGADVDSREDNGETPLHFAAYWNNEEVVRELLAAGASKDLRPWSGRWWSLTPFDLAGSDAVQNLLRL